MKRASWIFFIFLILSIPAKVEGQRWKLQRYEAAFGLGTTHMFGDVGKEADGIRSFQLIGTRPALDFYASFKFFQNLSVRLDLDYLMFGGIDANDQITIHSSLTHAFEHTARVELDFLSDGRVMGASNALFNRRGMVNNYNSTDFYIFAGFGGILSKAKCYDENYTEVINPYVQNNLSYSPVIPLGFGMKYSIDSYWSFNFEIGGRFTFSDKLDGYWNQDVQEQYKDRYITTSFKAIYKIRNDRRGRPIFNRYGR